MTAYAPTPDEWVDRFLGMPRERQLLVAAAVHTSVEQATHCYRAHRETPPTEPLAVDERAAALRAFSTMSDAVDECLRCEDDAEGRRTALRLFKTACAGAIDVLSPDDTTTAESEAL